jgi:hypothetical protein
MVVGEKDSLDFGVSFLLQGFVSEDIIGWIYQKDFPLRFEVVGEDRKLGSFELGEEKSLASEFINWRCFTLWELWIHKIRIYTKY